MGKVVPTLTNITYITKILPQNCPKTAPKLPQNCLKTFGFALIPPFLAGLKQKKVPQNFWFGRDPPPFGKKLIFEPHFFSLEASLTCTGTCPGPSHGMVVVD